MVSMTPFGTSLAPYIAAQSLDDYTLRFMALTTVSPEPWMVQLQLSCIVENNWRELPEIKRQDVVNEAIQTHNSWTTPVIDISLNKSLLVDIWRKYTDNDSHYVIWTRRGPPEWLEEELWRYRATDVQLSLCL